MALKELFSKMSKNSASASLEGDDSEENSQVESDSTLVDSEPPSKHPRIDTDSHAAESDSTSELSLSVSTTATKNRHYKQNMGYKPEYKRAYWWVRYDDSPGVEGMFCSVCEKWADTPKGNRVHQTWIKAPFKTWKKATEKLREHAQSQTHQDAFVKAEMAKEAERHGSVLERQISTARRQEEAAKARNRVILKKLFKCVYFLVKHKIAHTTTFVPLVDLLIDCGDQDLQQFFEQDARKNAQYRSTTAITELIEAISTYLECKVLDQVRKNHFFSVMADESCDVSSVEELSICSRSLNNGKPEEHFLKVIPLDRTDAETIAITIKAYLDENNLLATKIRAIGLDGAAAMSGTRTGVQARLRCHSPLAIYIHCRCHQLQLACVYAAKNIRAVSRVQSNILAIWKLFHYSPKKAAVLREIQAALAHPQLKMLKPGDTRWLSHRNSVHAIRRSFSPLVVALESIYEEQGDAKAFGLAKLVRSYNFIAAVSMLCDALDPVARLCTALQAKTLDFAELSFLVDACIADLEAMLNSPDEATEQFKKIDTLLSTELQEWDLQVSDEMKSRFKRDVFVPYFQNLIDNVKGRFEDSRGIVTALSVFDVRHLPKKESELRDYGLEQMRVLLDFYGEARSIEVNGATNTVVPDIDKDDTLAEWRIFKRLLYNQYKSCSVQDITSAVLASESQCLMFPNVVKLLQISQIIPLTTATVERSFSTLKLVKTNLRNRLKENMLDWCMRIGIEGPDSLSEEDISAIIQIWKGKKTRKLLL